MASSELPTEPAPTESPPAPEPAAHVEETSLARPEANGSDETSLARIDAPPDLAPPSAPEAPPPAPAITAPVATPADPLAPLEPRIRRIEEALERLVTLEQRVAETRIAAHPVATPAPPPPAAPAPTAVFLDVSKRLLTAAGTVTSPPGGGVGLLWLLRDTWAEARVIVRMFVDPRYQLPWPTRVLPLLLLAAILTSGFWVPGSSIPVLGGLLVKLVDLPLAFLLFKWLGHEARRYRQTSPDLPTSLRL